jgi:hypothetical protein
MLMDGSVLLHGLSATAQGLKATNEIGLQNALKMRQVT